MIVPQPNKKWGGIILHLLGSPPDAPLHVTAPCKIHEFWRRIIEQAAIDLWGGAVPVFSSGIQSRAVKISAECNESKFTGVQEVYISCQHLQFPSMGTWVALPPSGIPSFLVPARSRNAVSCIKTMLPVNETRMLGRTRRYMLTWLATHNLIMLPGFIRVTSSCSSFRQLCAEMLGSLPEPSQLGFRLGNGNHNRKTSVAVYSKQQTGTPLAYVQVADNINATPFLSNAAKFMQLLGKENEFKLAVPSIIGERTWQGRHVLATRPVTCKQNQKSDLPDEIMIFLKKLYCRFGRISILRESAFFSENLLLAKAADKISSDYRTVELLFEIEQRFGFNPVPLTLAHRDMDYKNATCHEGQVIVIDWEWARKDWPGLMDGINYIIYQPKTGNTGRHACEVVQNIRSRLKQSSVEIEELLTIYCIKRQHLELYVAMLLFDRAMINFGCEGQIVPEGNGLLLRTTQEILKYS